MREGGKARRIGRPAAHAQEEELLAKYFVLCASTGWPMTKRMIRRKAQQLAETLGNPFKGPEGQPSDKWWHAFKARYEDVFRMRRANKRKYAQAAAATRENLNSFYDKLGAKIEELQLDATRIYLQR